MSEGLSHYALVSMLQEQDELNKRQAGPEWLRRKSSSGKEINWYRAIYMEAAEAMDSLDWKHWKKSDPDMDNFRLELIDLWHFYMSALLEMAYARFRAVAGEDLYEKAARIHHMTKSWLFSSEKAEREGLLETIIEEASRQSRIIRNKGFAEANIASLYAIGASLSRLLENEGVDVELFYRGKKVLNRFRDDHGYKEGAYRKKWGKVEDNVVMMKLLSGMKTAREVEDRLYTLLESQYKILEKGE